MITEVNSRVLDVGRVSVWAFDDSRSVLTCKDLYKRSDGSHEQGKLLQAAAVSTFTEMLESMEVFATEGDARLDSRMSELAKTHLAPLGVTSVLAVPVKLVGW